MRLRPPRVELPPRCAQQPLHRHEGGATSVAISPDGRVLVSGGADGVVRLADLELGRTTFAVDVGAPVADVSTSASTAVAAAGRHLFRIPVHAGRVLGRERLGGDAVACAASPDGAWLAGLSDAELRVFRAASGKRVAREKLDGGAALRWSWAMAASTEPQVARLLLGRDGALEVRAPDGALREEVTLAGRPTDVLDVVLAATAVVGGRWHGATELPSLPEGLMRVDVRGDGAEGVACGADWLAAWGGGGVQRVDADVADVAWHPHGGFAAVAEQEGGVGLWTLAPLEPVGG